MTNKSVDSLVAPTVADGDVSIRPKIFLTDKIFQVTVLRFIPYWIFPNYVTFIRFCMVPSVIYFLIEERYKPALLLFTIAALTDALDGAMARTRNQITDWGKIYDPLADKLLICGVAIIMVSRFVIAPVTIMIVIIESLLVVLAIYGHYIQGKNFQARAAGKIKMVLQSFGIGFVFLFAIFGSGPFLVTANILLYISIVFALFSLFEYRSI